MNAQQFSERIGDLDDRLIEQAQTVPNFARQRRRAVWKRAVSLAAVIALMVCSGAVGAVAFGRETSREESAQRETVELAEIGVTLVLPESWAGKYRVVQGTFEPYGSPMWEVCVRSVYDARVPLGSSGGLFYRGTLFTVFQCADHSLSAEEFAQGSLAGIGQYLFATQNATYAVLYAGDIQADPAHKEQLAEWQAMAQTVREVQFLLTDVLD